MPRSAIDRDQIGENMRWSRAITYKPDFNHLLLCLWSYDLTALYKSIIIIIIIIINIIIIIITIIIITIRGDMFIPRTTLRQGNPGDG